MSCDIFPIFLYRVLEFRRHIVNNVVVRSFKIYINSYTQIRIVFIQEQKVEGLLGEYWVDIRKEELEKWGQGYLMHM